MRHKVIFKINRIDRAGNKTSMNNSPTSETFKSRKSVFEFLDEINIIQSKRLKHRLGEGERLEVEDGSIEIKEPVYEPVTLPSGKTFNKEIGSKTYTVSEYKSTFCRMCGRLLTDPESVKRGIGPDCLYKKNHPSSNVNSPTQNIETKV